MPSLPRSRYEFPDPMQVDPDGEGLVAIGADLTPSTILEAYRHGIFPWFSKGEPICWWSPEPRCVIYPEQYEPSKSLIRQLKKNTYTLTLSQCFEQVITACAQPRAYADETWINHEIIHGYCGLHKAGLAHSVEVWLENELVGGLYGVQIGGAFFGESMFSRKTDVSKMAFCFLMQLCKASKFPWVDCQLPNDHLMSMGATTLPRAQFLHQLPQVLRQSPPDWSEIRKQSFQSNQIFTPDAFLGLINIV